MITSITIENFKGIGKEVTVPLRPITLLFGKNSAGKSSILHAMLYAYEVLRTGDPDIDRVSLGGDKVDLGGFKSLVHGHDEEGIIRIGFEFDMTDARPDRIYPIGEFIETIEGSQVDLSDMGCEIETAKVILSIAEPGRGIVGYEVHINGIYFGETYESGQDGPWQRTHIIRVNLVHPLITWPVEMDEWSEGSIGPVDAYIDGLTNGLQKDYVESGRIEDAESQEHLEPERVEIINEAGLFVEGSLRRGLFSWTSPKEERRCAFHKVIGIRKDDGRLDVHSLVFVKSGLFPDHSAWTEDEIQGQLIEAKTKSWYDNPSEASGIACAVPSLHETIQIHPVLGELDETDTEAMARKAFAEKLITRIMVAPVEALKAELAKTRYIGPIREIPPRNLTAPIVHHPSDWVDGMAGWYTLLRAEPPQSGSSDDLIAKVEKILAEDLVLGVRIVRNDFLDLDVNGPAVDIIRLLPSLGGDVDTDTLRTLSESINSLDITPSLELWDVENDVPVACCDVGVGISQVIPVVVGALARYEGGGKRGVFAVEQPELHLHPAAQCGLGDAFIKAMAETTAPMIIETHSEHLLLRLLRRIAETAEGEFEERNLALDRTQLSALFVRSAGKGTQIIPLELSAEGDILTKLPEGFFDERMGELF